MFTRFINNGIPRRGIAGSSRSTMSNFLRNHQTDFQSGCTSLQPHHQWRNVPLFPHPCQHLLSPEFLILAILTVVRWNLRVILSRIFLMIKDVDHFFRCFCKAKDTINKTKRPPTNWERIFTYPKSDRGLISNIYKELKKVDFRKSNNPIKNGAQN